ncbi:MAG: VRR-NUC domain-containing protein [Acidobacteriota bacterium]|nr:VRR-NUC domain-containing protein [Acidobacteriota bacterium]
MPAELAVLAAELSPNESGAWSNSRGLSGGVVELQRDQADPNLAFRTRRIPFPEFVVSGLSEIRRAAGADKGCPDLVIWRTDQRSFRLVEVKCPHWDTPTREQIGFMCEATRRGIPTKVVEWEFDGTTA